MRLKQFVLASNSCNGSLSVGISMDVKSEKTFEEIVERLAALFRLTPHPVGRDYEESIEIDSNPQHSRDTEIASNSRKNKK
jgi:hypothetical protein